MIIGGKFLQTSVLFYVRQSWTSIHKLANYTQHHFATVSCAYKCNSRLRTKSCFNVNSVSVTGYLFNTFRSEREMSKFSNEKLVAVCQITAKGDKAENFDTCKALVTSAATAGAKVIFLPEGCDYVAETKEDSVKLSEPLTGELVGKYKELAKSLKVWISLGGIHEKINNGKVQNAHVIINDNGEVVSVYRKLHLFDVEIPEKNIRLKESDYVKPGNEIVKPVQSPVGEIGLSICYDLRFPELSQILRNMGAKILTYPSAFTFATGAMHWEVLLRGRAIETQCYVIAAAQTGAHNKKRTSWGHAMIVDPLGNVIAQCSEGTGFALAKIDLESIENVRKSMPISEHKRVDVYPHLMPNSDMSNPHCSTIGTSTNNDQSYQFGQVIIPEKNVFYKTALTMAFVNKRCVVPGHVLVAPLRPALRLIDLTSKEVSDLFVTVQLVQKVVEDIHKTSSSTIAVQDGPAAGRTITHLHVHILPRKSGDFLQNDQVYYELQQHDKSEDKPWRSQEEMNIEAEMLMKHFVKPVKLNN